jgi:hypothetical protein
MAGHGSIDHNFDEDEDRENVSPNVRDDNKPRFVAPKSVNASSYLQKVESTSEYVLISIKAP